MPWSLTLFPGAMATGQRRKRYTPRVPTNKQEAFHLVVARQASAAVAIFCISVNALGHFFLFLVGCQFHVVGIN